MATEAIWNLGTTKEISTLDDQDITDKQTFSVRIVAEMLYGIKQHLTASGWEVVSSSVRTSYSTDENAADMSFTQAGSDLWNPASPEESFKIIYPNITTTKTAGGSVYPYLSASSGGGGGRSWCLLKWNSAQELSQTGNPNRYHLLLDFASSTSKPAYSGFDSGDLDNAFGSQVGIYVFPNYHDEESNLWNSGNPATAFVRPHHKNEIGIPNKNAGSPQLFKMNSAADSIGGKLNFINGADIEGGTNHSFIITCSSSGTEKFLLVISKIADVLSVSPSKYNGTRYFMFWSNVLNSKKPFGQNLAVASNFAASSLTNTICDGRDEYSSIFYYRTYNANASPGNKYSPSSLNAAIPIFTTGPTRSDTTTPKIASILKTTEFSKVTSDGTYVEWPLPLIDIVGNNLNYRYAGRMLDIKMGPLLGPTGLLAKPSGASNYDRLLFNSLWLPYNSADAFDG